MFVIVSAVFHEVLTRNSLHYSILFGSLFHLEDRMGCFYFYSFRIWLKQWP